MEVTFKTASTEPVVESPRESDFVENIHGITTNIVENTNQVVLGAIGLGDVFNNLPANEKGYIKSIADTLDSLVGKRGLQPTEPVYNRLLAELRDDMEIDPDTDPAILLEKMGKTLNAWRDLSFMRDPAERRRVFMKLAKSSTSKEMDSILLDTMERYGQ